MSSWVQKSKFRGLKKKDQYNELIKFVAAIYNLKSLGFYNFLDYNLKMKISVYSLLSYLINKYILYMRNILFNHFY